jgi:hypothetical protein
MGGEREAASIKALNRLRPGTVYYAARKRAGRCAGLFAARTGGGEAGIRRRKLLVQRNVLVCVHSEIFKRY